VPGARSDSTIGRTTEHFRPDIEGLRGVAVMLVVVFHAFPALLGGGFIGVDVFFVISGFLITGLLVRELEGSGRLDLRAFYVRRIRRLVPAAALALGVTLLLSAWLLPPLDLREAAVDALSATFSVSNIRFALGEGDYFAAVANPSPFLHYWSLSVEEQYYLLWPALLIVLYKVAPGRRSLFTAVALLAAISLGAALLVTDVAPAWAFYSLPTRAWQLALGGLLALALVGRPRGAPRAEAPPAGVRDSGPLAAIGWLGLAAVVLAAVVLNERLAYPGAWALLPTLGAVAIIAVGRQRRGPALILSTRPVRFLGRISYALYLWHWPLLVLPAIALGAELTPAGRLGLIGLAMLAASASTLLIEEPVRRVPVSMPRQRQLDQAVGLVAVLLASVAVGLGSVTWVRAAAEAEAGGQEPQAVGQREPRARDRADRSAGGRRDGPGDARIEVGRQLDRTEPPEPEASRRS
jgi:peptidoglycan/LPS O-acetylase OafA/YrhL